MVTEYRKNSRQQESLSKMIQYCDFYIRHEIDRDLMRSLNVSTPEELEHISDCLCAFISPICLLNAIKSYDQSNGQAEFSDERIKRVILLGK